MFVAKGCCALSEVKGKASSLVASGLTVLAMLGQIPIDNTFSLVKLIQCIQKVVSCSCHESHVEHE